jgi:hypothetical protein
MFDALKKPGIACRALSIVAALPRSGQRKLGNAPGKADIVPAQGEVQSAGKNVPLASACLSRLARWSKKRHSSSENETPYFFQLVIDSFSQKVTVWCRGERPGRAGRAKKPPGPGPVRRKDEDSTITAGPVNFTPKEP